MAVRVRLDRRGLEAIAESAGMLDALEEAAEAVASNIEGMGIRVEHIPGDIALPVEVGRGDAAAFVTLAHPSGNAVQAKDGALTKGAAEAGLRVGR